MQKTNDAARRMVTLATPLGTTFEPTGGKVDPIRTALSEYVMAQQVRADAVVVDPPAEVIAYLDQHEAQIDALREHLLHGETIVWDRDLSKGFDAPLPYLLGHMDVARLFTTRALLRGRANDPRAWDDLHAAWRVAQILEPRPELISQMICMAITRFVNGAAWKIPQAPNANWFAEVQQIDHRRLLLGAYQSEMYVMWRNGERATMNGAMATIGKPYMRWAIIDMARRQRKAAEQLAAMTTCSLEPVTDADIPQWNIIAKIATPGNGAWQRAFRTIAEREATMNAIRIAQGQAIVAESACSDGKWRFENDRLSYSGPIAASGPTEKVMPLSLVIPARGTRRSI
jgi:hypothetical protein